MKKLNKKGFTIVELVIVIGVIGILSAILIPTFVNLTSQAKEKQIQANLRNAYVAYVAEAADGVIGDTKNEIVLVAEAEVVLKDGSAYYTWNSTKEVWEEQPAAPTKDADESYTYALADVAEAADDSTYNGVVVQYFKATPKNA